MKKFSLLAIVFALFAVFSCKNNDNGISKSDLPDGVKISDVENIFDLVYGGSGNNDDELTSGMVADNSGNMYVSMNVTNTQANKNIIVIRINSDGTLAWGKQYDSAGNEWSPDSGENGETGGTTGSISMDNDGNIYVVGLTDNEEIGYAVLIMKINPANGEIIWQKAWKPEWPAEGSYPLARQDAEGYAIDATGDYVYVTGDCGTNQVLVLAFNKSDGSIVFQKGLDIVSGTKDRGYAIKEDASGNLFLGGVNGSYAWIAKLTNANTNSPEVAWLKNAGLSYGARINGIEIDDSGVYYSCDIRGVNTTFEIFKTDFDGNVKWAKSFPGASNDRNNTHTVYINGNYVYAGGRTGQTGMDLMGDALFVKMNKNDGSIVWAGIYYTGKDAEESASQRIKGIAVVGDNVYIAGQIYPVDQNIEHYYGSWVEDKSWATADESVSPSAITPAEFMTFETGEVRDASINVTDYSVGTLQNSEDKTASNPPDCDVFLMKFKL